MIVYLECDALLTLYLRDHGREAARRAQRKADAVATTAIGYPWLRASLAAACRERWISPQDYQTVLIRMNLDWAHLVRVPATEALLRRSGDLAERWALDGRAGVELASALVLCQYRDDAEICFGSLDRRLAHAAEGEGLKMMELMCSPGEA